ncbi:hypothetical protein ACHAXR_012694, partial [Thalassiosira sp. AJA248-18]
MNNTSAYHRPFQSSSSISTPINEKIGRKLLDILRSRDKLITKRSSPDDDENHQNNNDDNDDDDIKQELFQLEQELITQLHSLNASIRRCGLFTNNTKRAQSFYNLALERSSMDRTAVAAAETNGAEKGGGGSSNNKKRKRKKGGAGGGGAGNNSSATSSVSAASYGVYLDSHANTQFSGVGLSAGGGAEKQDLDEGLILTAICRMLSVTVGRKKKKKDDDGDDNNDSLLSNTSNGGMMCAALNVLCSLCDHAKDGMVPSLTVEGNSTVCASIEGDMIGSIGYHLLDALCDNILYSYYSCQSGDETSMKRLAGCFKACASVVSLLETRLSRADKTMQGLRDVTWLVLNNLNNGLSYSSGTSREEILCVQKAATVLLATLPLAGNSDGTPSSKIWSRSVTDGITLMGWAIHGFFPMPSAQHDGKNNNRSSGIKLEARQYPNLWKEHETWLAIAKDAPPAFDEEVDLGNDPTDAHRSQALQSRIQCLSSYIHSLLKMEGYPLHRSNSLSSTTLLFPLDALLDTSEILLSFPLAAEAKHRMTKSRLRSSPVKDGLISPNTAMDIAPHVRLCGHALLDVTVESCRGGSGALSKARRLVGMAVANLQSSCSLALVSVVDGRRSGSNSADKVSRMGSWLRGSIPLRMKSIQTYHSVVLSLGSGVMSSSGTAKSICRALVLVGGSLLEQVTGGEEAGRDGRSLAGVGDEWGTLGERAKLVETASNALASCIAAFGGLIPNNVRSTIDSITHTCLTKLYSCGGSSIFAYSHVKRSTLQLGMNCICVPWGDGGRSNVTEIVRTVSSMLRNDPDLSVASTALSTLCACDAFTTPRAPPILIPTRGSVEGTANSGSGFTASSLLQGMAESKMEMLASNEAKEERRAKKSDKKSSKKAKHNSLPLPTKEVETKEVDAKVQSAVASSQGTGDATPVTETFEVNNSENEKDSDNLGTADSKTNTSESVAEEQIKSVRNKAETAVSTSDYVLGGKTNSSGEVANESMADRQDESQSNNSDNIGDAM